VRDLRREYEARFRRLIDELPLPHAIDRRYLRLLLFGALNWSQVWYNPGGDPPEVVARHFVNTLRYRLDSEAAPD
jgi:TetR/AcrR family transcriptional regulator, cholesterol catabolism regulator